MVESFIGVIADEGARIKMALLDDHFLPRTLA